MIITAPRKKSTESSRGLGETEGETFLI